MRYEYSLTFEFDTQPPILTNGTIDASSLRTATARAVDDSIKKYANTYWRSVVIVIERGK